MKTKYDYIIKFVATAVLSTILGVGIGIYADVQQLKSENKTNTERIEKIYSYLLEHNNKLAVK